jgi:predicted nucleic acid-binding protein
VSGPVLVDTGAWLAVMHGRDQFHAAAATALRRLREERRRLVLTNLILAELHLHLLHGLGPVRAARLAGTVLADPLTEEVFVDRSLQSAAFTDWIQRFTDQAFTLTDAASFAVMRARAITVAFTFDRHFSVAGFQIVP